MFSKSTLLLGLGAASAAFKGVSGDVSPSAAAAAAAEASLVAQLIEAPSAASRVGILSSDSEFQFDFLNPPTPPTTGKGGSIVLASSANFPAVIGLGSAMAVGFLDACSMNTPHTHPRATEMQFSVNGTIRTGMITENGARFILNEIQPGQMTIFPMGSIHFQINDGCEPITFVSTFNSDDPGALQIAQRFLGLPFDITGATLGDIGVEEIVGLEAQIPDNVALGTDACLQKCGLTRSSQPTNERQPRVSGNAIPSGYSSTYGGSGYTNTYSSYNTKSTSTPPYAYTSTTYSTAYATGTAYKSYATPSSSSSSYYDNKYSTSTYGYGHYDSSSTDKYDTSSTAYKSYTTPSSSYYDNKYSTSMYGYGGGDYSSAYDAAYGDYSSPYAAVSSGYAAGGHLAADLATDGSSSSNDDSKLSPLLIALIVLNAGLALGLIVLGACFFRSRRAASRSRGHRALYTNVSTAGDPIFTAPSKVTQYEADEEKYGSGGGASDSTPLTHGLSHGPYYDPHEGR
ncbi:hypothetical protein FB45DRAFT_997827 [Roridomyces roridus]|uniref:Cupin type-1 domain-containing protein n=1 Tax=Roridomyces roridus TaxID=1738132 RepID=A0AAD7FZA0_9AGAR|nr:hypothetical protein FB45DRAFT_997827 [Roridomyces roridus]